MLLLPDTRILRPNEKPSFEHTQKCGLDWQNAKVSLEGCISYWIMNERAGNQVFDLSGNGNTGAGSGAISWVGGDKGIAVRGEGNADAFIFDDAILIANGNPWTVTFRAKQDAGAGTAGMVSGYIASGDDFIWLREGSYFYVRTNDENSIFEELTDFTAWHDYSVVCDGTTISLYRDNIFINSKTPADTQLWMQSILAGHDTRSQDFKGEIQYYYLYNRTFSVSEINQLNREPFCQLWKPKTQIVVGWVSGGAPPATGIPILRRRRECA